VRSWAPGLLTTMFAFAGSRSGLGGGSYRQGPVILPVTFGSVWALS
jgi:hypothetical protein